MANTTLFRGTITKITTDGVYVEIPKLGVGQEFGPCEALNAGDYNAGGSVLCANIGRAKEDIAVLGPMTTEIEEAVLSGGDITLSDDIVESWVHPDPPPWGTGGGGGSVDLTDYFKVNDRTKHVPAFGLYFPEVNGADPTGAISAVAAINATLEEMPDGGVLHLSGTYRVDAPIELKYSGQRVVLTSGTKILVSTGYAGDVFRIGNSAVSIRGVIIEGSGVINEDGKSGGGSTVPGAWTAVRFIGYTGRGATACHVRDIQIQWCGDAIAYEAQGTGWVNGNIVSGIRVLYPRVYLHTLTPGAEPGYESNAVQNLMGQSGNYTEYGAKNLSGRNWTLTDVSPWDLGYNPAAISAEIAATAKDIRIFGGLLTSFNYTNNAGSEVTVLDRFQPKPWAATEDFYPENYGAVADGVTDDRTAIQATITEAVSKGGRVVFTKGKTYAIGFQILVQNTDYVRIGGGGTIKVLPSSVQRAFLIQNSSHLTIEDITIDCNKDESTGTGTGNSNWQGIYVSSTTLDVSHVTIRNVTVKDGFQRGIAVIASANRALSHITIEDCTVTNVGDTGIHVNGHANVDKTTPATTTGITIRGNRLSQIAGNGIHVFGASFVDVSDNILDGVGSQGHGICFSTSGTDTWVTDFTCARNKVRNFSYDDGASKWGIVVSTSSTRFTLSDNIVSGCAGNITVDPEDGNFQDVRTDVAATISGNITTDSVSNNGLNVRMCENATITGNTSLRNALSGIALASALHCSITGNTSIGNGARGIAVFGVEPGSGGHTIGPNNAHDNVGGDVYSANPPVPSEFLSNNPEIISVSPGEDIQGALNTADIVELIGDHTITSTITVPTGVTLRRGKITTATAGRMISLGSGSILDRVTIDAPGSILGTTGAVETTGHRAEIRDCEFTSTDRDAWHLAIQSSATDTVIKNTTFNRCAVGVHVNPGVTGVTVDDCTFTDWTSRCVSLNATTAGFSKIRIRNNEFGPLSSATTAAAPRVAVYIRSSAEAYRTRDIEISGNRVIGNSLAHSETSLGPADMLSLHRLEDARVINNYLLDPGEVGIHVGQGSQKVVVSGNIILAADTTGIVIGEVTATYRTKEITVTDNIVMDSNQDRLGTLPDTVTGGISLRNVDQAVVTGNRSGNTIGFSTQGHGVKVVDCNNVEIGTNALSNNRLGEHYVEASTGVSFPNQDPAETSTSLNSATNAINTNSKYAGKIVFNTTSNRPVWATGNAATSVWVWADGTTANTPV